MELKLIKDCIQHLLKTWIRTSKFLWDLESFCSSMPLKKEQTLFSNFSFSSFLHKCILPSSSSSLKNQVEFHYRPFFKFAKSGCFLLSARTYNITSSTSALSSRRLDDGCIKIEPWSNQSENLWDKAEIIFPRAHLIRRDGEPEVIGIVL